MVAPGRKTCKAVRTVATLILPGEREYKGGSPSFCPRLFGGKGAKDDPPLPPARLGVRGSSVRYKAFYCYNIMGTSCMQEVNFRMYLFTGRRVELPQEKDPSHGEQIRAHLPCA